MLRSRSGKLAAVALRALALGCVGVVGGCGSEFTGTTEVFTVHSADIDDDYTLRVHIPRGQSVADLGLVVQLDGNRQSEPVAAEAEALGVAVVVVGVDHSARRNESRRLRDYTPTNDSRVPGSGGAGLFIEFLTDDVLPIIASQYGAVPTDVTLMGHSAAGEAVIYAALTQPAGDSPFTRFVAASPALWFDDGAIFGFEPDRDDELPGSTLVGVGAMESVIMVGYGRELVDRLDARSPRAAAEFVVHPNTPHEGSWLPTYRHALESIDDR